MILSFKTFRTPYTPKIFEKKTPKQQTANYYEHSKLLNIGLSLLHASTHNIAKVDVNAHQNEMNYSFSISYVLRLLLFSPLSLFSCLSLSLFSSSSKYHIAHILR